jgi:hypothetical protein
MAVLLPGKYRFSGTATAAIGAVYPLKVRWKIQITEDATLH